MYINKLKLLYLRCFVICSFFCFPFNSFGQFNATYIFYINSEISGTIQLNDKSHYEINIDFFRNEDNSLSFLLSRGNYKLVEGELKLSDSFNNYSQSFKIDKGKKNLAVLNSFGWFHNLSIKKLKDYSSLDNKIFNRASKISQIRKKSKTRENPTLYYSNYNDYLFKDFNVFSLDLRKTNKYYLKFCNFVISEGIFTKKGNEIILHDNSINHNFYGFLSNNYINCYLSEIPLQLKKE